MYRVKQFKMTCSSCPSQWEGKIKLDDGRERGIYIRYRWSHLWVYFGFKEEHPHNIGKLVWEKRNPIKAPHEVHGDMTTQEMMECTKELFDWDGAEELP